jgi:hypothetical protein
LEAFDQNLVLAANVFETFPVTLVWLSAELLLSVKYRYPLH